MNLFELTRELINIPSVTGSEGDIADFLALYLKKQGFDVDEQEVEERRRNIFASAGPSPGIVLCTHMDTVPGHFPAAEDNSFIYGRGACDAKGALSAMAVAAQELKEEGVNGLGLVFVVGEETDSRGAKKANDSGRRSEYIIVGEPTENKLGSGHKGVLNFKIKTKGKKAHSAYPHLGESAIDKILDVLQSIRHLAMEEHPVLGKTTVNIGVIEGGVASNVVADSATAILSLRTGFPSNKIVRRIKTVAGPRAEIEILSRSEPQILFTIPGFDEVVLPYCTDIPYLQSFGRPLLLGPGSALVAHTDAEKVEKGQLLEAVGNYKKLAKILLERIST
ncbi:MAG: M20/M25/M40 family metallo-hydrolase [Candidatus Aminicenantales bacterium]